VPRYRGSLTTLAIPCDEFFSICVPFILDSGLLADTYG
jgi:hypothetical protein